MVNSKEFAKRLEKIFEHYGLSATAFAERIDFNRSTISHILSGRNKPSLEFVMKVVHEFPEVELYWLLNGKGSFPIDTEEKTDVSPTKTSEERSLVSKNIKQSLPTTQTEAFTSSTSKEIDQIILLYKDGSFKVYKK
ncbi:helix-turn-helix domain-containing protein [Luteirhabdus pelagi]|uniref:helix-turn-helix domain-containing protein n=1 Tax=Luteirhabdus pelagi TaxID=2792783 RepID=UPI00193A71DE|nr:helix-turn-helix transcriptional regulator [Luteirhabdus pelagi]